MSIRAHFCKRPFCALRRHASAQRWKEAYEAVDLQKVAVLAYSACPMVDEAAPFATNHVTRFLDSRQC